MQLFLYNKFWSAEVKCNVIRQEKKKNYLCIIFAYVLYQNDICDHTIDYWTY